MIEHSCSPCHKSRWFSSSAALMSRTRLNGEGTIYWNERRQRWMAVLTLQNGQRKWFSARTAVEVEPLLTAAKAARNSGLPVATGKKTVEEYFTWWLEEVARPSLKAGSFQRYGLNVRLHILPEHGR